MAVDRQRRVVEPYRCFRFGGIEVSVRSELPDVLDDLDALYDGCRLERAGQDAIRVEARRGGRSRWGGRRYVVLADGLEFLGSHTRDEVLPHVEWAINGRVIVNRSDYLQLHAAALARDGRALLLAGDSGSGKSTLAAGLMARGWTYLCDELALLDPRTLYVHPFPRALCIKEGSFSVMRELGLPLWRRRHYSKHFKGPVGYVSPRATGQPAVVDACPVHAVIFPRYAANCTPRLQPLPRAAAACALAGCTLNPHAFARRVMPIICKLLRHCDCFQLEAGPIAQTCALIESAALRSDEA